MDKAAAEVWKRVKDQWKHAYVPEYRPKARKPYVLLRRDNAKALEAGHCEELWGLVEADWTACPVPKSAHMAVTR